MGLLDDLKRQAEQLQAHRSAQARGFSESVLQVDEAMHHAFLYLNDLTKQLNVLNLPSPRTFDLEPGVRFEGMRLTDFFIDFRKKLVEDRERYDHINLTFQQKSSQTIQVRKELPPNIARFEANLRAAGAVFEVNEVRNVRHMVTHADFTIQCVLRAGIRITPDYESCSLRFTLRNIERLGGFALVFAAEEITDPLLEDCARYIMGEPNQFRALGRFVSLAPGA
ncbi:MAG: hypothetical protein JNM90_08550 [Burkholderiales bacterium]|nr:hypothetical protein [Burkholderiales bacterium]